MTRTLDSGIPSVMVLCCMRLGIVLFLSLSSLGCAGLRSGGSKFTVENNRRVDQLGWVKEDLAMILARHFADISQRDPDNVDMRLVADINKALQICFNHGSSHGVDMDGGIRAMNFFRKAYFRAGGEYWTWQQAVRDRRVKPHGEEDRFYPSAIPEGYK